MVRPIYVKLVGGKLEARHDAAQPWCPLWCDRDVEAQARSQVEQHPSATLKVEAYQNDAGRWQFRVTRTETRDGTQSNSNL